MSSQQSPLVSVIMGSDSDWPTMEAACDILDKFNVPYEKKVVSAHRTPDLMAQYGKEARQRGIQVIIAGAGGAAHLPGMTAAHTTLPVIGVPVKTSTLSGLDSLYSIVQMPPGVPVATVAIGKAGNAALLAIRMLSMENLELSQKLAEYHDQMAEESRAKTKNLT
ncbi:5-(carboxyamino)imidazole ribonucleotide mutase [Fodinibius salinus]|uniref:N5-carboxyaminoimidazole ribonucleotide mutase n=1 Tax=Fodinibius salinus TaxID=860790 RepID=A0A5D3YQH4_9BACT|nr:5-(carboxyamino)imidazole ribonucleotide mutase [Fodinibius salinus]TYP95309.1 5-(carboxyamino)imidazole ribonucleotide mutase [Fodinibius salinus]